MVRMYNRSQEDTLDGTDVTVSVDGRSYSVKAGEDIILTPGESITIYPYQYHSFWAQEGSGSVLIGEVSLVNDDRIDNRFLDAVGRFPKIEEDEQPLYLLSSDYQDIV